MTERNPILQSLFDRKSVRVYEEKPIPAELPLNSPWGKSCERTEAVGFPSFARTSSSAVTVFLPSSGREPWED